MNQIFPVNLFAKKNVSQTISGLWTYENKLIVDITDNSNYCLQLDNSGIGNLLLEFKNNGASLGRIQTILGILSIFSAASTSMAIGLNDLTAASTAFTLYNAVGGELANVGTSIRQQVVAGPLTWLDVFNATYQGVHTFSNHRVASSGNTWLFQNIGLVSGGNIRNTTNNSISIETLDWFGNLTTTGNHTGLNGIFSADVSGVNSLFTGYREYTEIVTPSSPSANQVRQYLVDRSGLSVLHSKDSTGFDFELGQDNYIIAQNVSGSTLNIGQVVCIVGAASNVPTLNLASNNTTGRYPAIGLVAESITNNSFGRILTYGILENIDTSSFSLGALLYLSTSGGLTATRPTVPARTQVIGYVTRFSASGSIFVMSDFGQNDLNGTINSDFTIGNTGGGQRSVTFYNNSGSSLILRATPSAARTVSIPDSTGTVALLERTQTFTQNQTFTLTGTFNGELLKRAGSGSAYARCSGRINVNTTAVGNVGAGEDNLIVYTVPANTLLTNSDFLDFEFFGTFAANANSKRIKAYFGATVIFDSGAQLQNGGSWKITGKIIRTGGTTQKVLVEFTSSSTLFVNTTTYTATALTLSSTNDLKVTGEAVADNDIVNEALIVNWTGT